ncbi:hypothetical protein CTI12_AA254880 [Artemisia annua]|uniref:Retrotransposon gag domain-containing protein n=1 Tax=Artemisia annua TaxID=35608 RepID=A0A2U1NKX1_ARTAN|nr:hypothetical protein CTI12_AA254880 [Artemisia annua]
MDEQMVRLWLKEHQDTAEKVVQQQTAAFTLQFDTLRAELQAIRGPLPNQNGGDGDHGMLLPRAMRLDVPKFNGADPDGDAAEWHRWMTRNKLITTWDSFLESVKNRFEPFKYEDPQGALSKLLQTATVTEYQSEFEKLMNRVMNISDNLLISFYISGLKLTLQLELLVTKPTSLGEAFYLARVAEARLEAQSTPLRPTPPKPIVNPHPLETHEVLTKTIQYAPAKGDMGRLLLRNSVESSMAVEKKEKFRIFQRGIKHVRGGNRSRDL